MATAKERLDVGDLSGAIAQLTQDVKANPSDIPKRTFLFELLCFAGEFDRAERQLDVISHQSAQAEIGVQVYRNNIKAERARGRLLREGLLPHFLAEPPAYIDWHLEAINRLRADDGVEARALLDRAEEARPALAGRLNGRPFQDFRDCDDVVAPVLEVIVRDQYAWVPFEQIQRLELSPPKYLRDLLWIVARIEARDGTVGEVFVPTLYADSSRHPEDRVKLGRMTDWTPVGGDLYRAAGLRMFLVDQADKALLSVRNLEFDPPGAESPEASPS